jgi:hypothetical protein
MIIIVNNNLRGIIMAEINGMDNNKININIISIVIITEIKMEMNMLNIVIKDKKKNFLMIFLIKRTVGMKK